MPSVFVRVLAAAAVCAAAAAAAAASDGTAAAAPAPAIHINHDHWPTMHHDLRNSGRSFLHMNFTNYNGSCLHTAGKFQGSTFGVSGASSQDGSIVYYGTAQNTIVAIDPKGGSTPVEIPLPAEDGPGGIVGAPMVVYRDNFNDELLLVASTNGFLYFLQPDNCNTMVVMEAGSAAQTAATDATQCLIWKTALRGPVYMSPRLTTVNTTLAAVDQGLALVSSTGNNTDTKGILYAVNMTDGKIVWEHHARTKLGETTYGLQTVPAVDVTRGGTIYVAYGPYVVALSPADGSAVATFTGNPDDMFASGVSLASDAKALYVQSESSSLWRIGVTGSSIETVAFSGGFSCLYIQGTTHCAFNNITNVTAADPAVHRALIEPRVAAHRAAAAAADGLHAGSGSIFALSTPALTPDDHLVFAVNAATPTDGALVIVDRDTADATAWFNGTQGIVFGSSRSSPAVDAKGVAFVGSDSPDGPGGFLRPLLWAVDVTDSGSISVLALRSIGLDDQLIGAGSPLLTSAFDGSPVAVMAVNDKVTSSAPGYSCPSNNPLIACSANGNCDCTTGQCACNDDCYSGAACDVPKNCGPHSSAGCVNGNCDCDACWTGPACNTTLNCGEHSAQGCNPTTGKCICDKCWGGELCNIPLQCSGNGLCNPDSGVCECDKCHTGANCSEPKCKHALYCDTSTGQCTCNGCYEGETCSTPVDCGPHAGAGCVHDRCQCDNCYSGDRCNILDTCNNNGVCNPTSGACQCRGCKTGTNCDQDLTCNNRGTCNPVTNKCVCHQHTTGKTCNACVACYNGPNCETECSGHGACLGNGLCACAEGYSGDFCENKCPPCYVGTSCGMRTDCNGHGTCSGADGCSCNHGYIGAYCEFPAAKKKGNSGAVAGGVIGALAIVGIGCGVFYFRGNIRRWYDRSVRKTPDSTSIVTSTSYGAM